MISARSARARRRALQALLASCILIPSTAAAQPFETVGVRALGMGGAFVAVADDATAIWWNAAGLATGGVFSMTIEYNSLDIDSLADELTGRSATAIMVGTPPLGLGYVRTKFDGPLLLPNNTVQHASLVTHQVGVTLLQTLLPGLTVGGTIKFVRGEASIGPEQLLGRATNAVDVDAGGLFVSGPWRAGVTVRNIVEPEFDTIAGVPLRTQRVARELDGLHGRGSHGVDLDAGRRSGRRQANACGRRGMAMGAAAGRSRRLQTEHIWKRARSGGDRRLRNRCMGFRMG
jgi:F plasmid transfer operon, TraF, protein